MLLELKGCDPEILNDLPLLRTAMLKATEEVGGTVIDHIFHQFNPYGVTGVVAIAESHLCIHTWPEYGYAAVDIFTCGDSLMPMSAARFLIKQLHVKEHSVIELKRGVIPQVVETSRV